MDSYSVNKFIFGIVCAMLFIYMVRRLVPRQTTCGQYEMLNGDNKCVPKTNFLTCVPTKAEEDKNAEVYQLSENKKCVPDLCKRGFELVNNKCVNTTTDGQTDRETVENYFNDESRSTNRVFIKIADDFNIDTIVTKFLNYEECSTKGNIIDCAKSFADYCDNNPTGQKFSAECGLIVSNIGTRCNSSLDCGLASMTCKRTPDGSKSYCA